jgi:hypothetical protein
MTTEGGFVVDDSSRNDIRRILKTFGIQADEAMVAHLARHPEVGKLQIRLVLQDLTDYSDSPPKEPLHLEMEGEINR